jgi:hypothetical protein
VEVPRDFCIFWERLGAIIIYVLHTPEFPRDVLHRYGGEAATLVFSDAAAKALFKKNN